MTINRKHTRCNASSSRKGGALWLPALIMGGLLLICSAPVTFGELVLPEIPRKKKKEAKGEVQIPPQAVPVEVEITPGSDVDIPLRVYGWRGRNVRYLLRSRPKAGKFEIIQGANAQWTLRYRHNGDIPPEEGAVDRFLYVAQDPIATSPSAEIRVKITDFPPQFEMPSALPFGKTTTGTPLTQKITLANRGGGLIVGQLYADAPWSVSPAEFQLPRGSEKEITVTFHPESEQAFRGRITVAGQPEASLALTGSAYDAFRVEPAQLDLTPEPGGITRSGSITLSNRTTQPQTLTLSTDARLALPEELTLPAGESTTLSIDLGEDDLSALQAQLTISDGKIQRSTKISAAAIGARLFAEGLDFGTVSPAKEDGVERTLTVANRGGSSAKVAVTTPPGITVAPMQFDLQAGSEGELKVTFTPSTEGDYKGTLRLQSNTGQQLDLPLAAVVSPSELVGTPALLSDSTAEASTSIPPLAGASGTDTSFERARLARLAPPKGDPSVPTVKGVTPRQVGAATVELSWEAPEQGQSLSYQLERQRIFQDSFGRTDVAWQPIPGVVVNRAGTRLTALIPDIAAGTRFSARITSISSEGKLSAPSEIIPVAIPAPAPFFSTQRLLLGFFSLLGLGALWLRFRPTSSHTPKHEATATPL